MIEENFHERRMCSKKGWLTLAFSYDEEKKNDDWGQKEILESED